MTAENPPRSGRAIASPFSSELKVTAMLGGATSMEYATSELRQSGSPESLRDSHTPPLFSVELGTRNQNYNKRNKINSRGQSKRTKSLGVRLCPMCQKPGRLKAMYQLAQDQQTECGPYYVMVHSQPKTRRMPYYGKYVSSCYIGKLTKDERDTFFTRMDVNA